MMAGWKQETVIWRDTTDSGTPLAAFDILLTPPVGTILEIDGQAWTVVGAPDVAILRADPPYRERDEVSATLIVTKGHLR